LAGNALLQRLFICASPTLKPTEKPGARSNSPRFATATSSQISMIREVTCRSDTDTVLHWPASNAHALIGASRPGRGAFGLPTAPQKAHMLPAATVAEIEGGGGGLSAASLDPGLGEQRPTRRLIMGNGVEKPDFPNGYRRIIRVSA